MPVQSPGHLVIPLTLISKVVAVSAQEVFPRPVKYGYPPTAAAPGQINQSRIEVSITISPIRDSRRPGQSGFFTRRGRVLTLFLWPIILKGRRDTA